MGAEKKEVEVEKGAGLNMRETQKQQPVAGCIN